ncbi:MAG: cell division ATP-binding protein FtsE [Deltaproteobacteria bacterium]|nr:cell division ATP-binding protein FtsE [Deltaproteobacteria bacterium]MBW1871012.1 cell division ATP-binding protein FtsE [Deltaproteobacteria bacterium]
MIQMYHVHMSYGPGSPALVDITLRVEKAEFVFVTGPSGAGKTSLLRLIFMAERCESGQILLFGQNVARLKEKEIPFIRRRIGVVFQDFKLLASRTVKENIGLVFEVLGKPRREIARKTNEVLRLVGLEHKANSYPLKLSGGEQQRVAIARAIVSDPQILLADEPTGNLDPELSREIYKLLNEINARGVTVVVATHDIGWVGRTQKRVIQLQHSRVVTGGLKAK